jgi:hypothetical protein
MNSNYNIEKKSASRIVKRRISIFIFSTSPWIVMVCLYKRLFLDYTYGLGKIYTEAEIAAAKQSPSFEREYNLKYLVLIGNVFHTKDIEAAMERGLRL